MNNERRSVQTTDYYTARTSQAFQRNGQGVPFTIRSREFSNRIRGFSYSVGFTDGDGKFVPTVNIRHELIPEVVKELMSLYEGHQALIEQDKVDRPPRHERRDERPWDGQPSKQQKKSLRQLTKPPRQNDLSKADERSRREKQKNAKLFEQQKQGGHDEGVPGAGEARREADVGTEA